VHQKAENSAGPVAPFSLNRYAGERLPASAQLLRAAVDQPVELLLAQAAQTHRHQRLRHAGVRALRHHLAEFLLTRKSINSSRQASKRSVSLTTSLAEP
jgi:hypothetical protein